MSSKRGGGHTILVPKYKRNDKGLLSEREALIGDYNASKGNRMESLLDPDQYAQYLIELYEFNWCGKYHKLKAIVADSDNPLTDRKCWAKLGAHTSIEERAKLLVPKNIKLYTSEHYCTEQYLLLSSYPPNEMSWRELCGYALNALCMPAEAQKTAQILWKKMLELFLAMDIDVKVAEALAAGVNDLDTGFSMKKSKKTSIVDLAKKLERMNHDDNDDELVVFGQQEDEG